MSPTVLCHKFRSFIQRLFQKTFPIFKLPPKGCKKALSLIYKPLDLPVNEWHDAANLNYFTHCIDFSVSSTQAVFIVRKFWYGIKFSIHVTIQPCYQGDFMVNLRSCHNWPPLVVFVCSAACVSKTRPVTLKIWMSRTRNSVIFCHDWPKPCHNL